MKKYEISINKENFAKYMVEGSTRSKIANSTVSRIISAVIFGTIFAMICIDIAIGSEYEGSSSSNRRLSSQNETLIGIGSQKTQYTPSGTINFDTFTKDVTIRQLFFDTKYKTFTGAGLNNYYFGAGYNFSNTVNTISQFTINSGFTFDLANYSPTFESYLLSIELGYSDRKVAMDSKSATGDNRYQSNFGRFQYLSLGTKIEKILDDASTVSVKLSGLFPNYKSTTGGENTNYSENSGGGLTSFGGYQIKLEYATAITRRMDAVVFASYEAMKFSNLNQTVLTQNSNLSPANQLGSAKLQTISMGIGLVF